MFDLYLIIDIIVVVALLILGLTALLKNRSLVLNQIFSLFVLFISVWIIANYISNNIKYAPETAVLANYFVFFFSYSAAVYLLRFAIILAGDKRSQKILKACSFPLFLVGAMSFTPLIVAGAHVQGKVYAVQFGPGAPVYFVTLGLVVLSVLYVIYKNIKVTTNDQRGRLKVLFVSLCWTFPVLLLSNFILPATTGWFGLTNVGILPMLILVFGLYYGVVKHRLFDLRLVIVRSVTYVITLGTISGVYAAGSYYISTIFSRLHNIALGDFLNVLLIAIAITTYAPVKRVFDRLTNKFFYKDAYDPQSLFDELNRTLVSSLDIVYLMNESSRIISSHLKLETTLIVLKNGDGSFRLFGAKEFPIARSEADRMRRSISKIPESVVVVDYLEHEHVQSILQKHNVAAIVRLTPNVQANDEGLGYIVLGSKRSGGPFTRQDVRTLDTVANELIIAVQNALRFEEIQQFNVTLQQRIEEATRRLRRTNDKLRQLDETKDDFISMASHQLRTPLTSVKGYVSMVIDGDAGPLTSLQRKLLNQSFISAQRMVYLISDLLNVSRLRTGKFVIEPVPTNLATMVQEEVVQLVETAKGRNLELIYHKPEHFPVVMLDETKIRQVIMNFIDNAIYYTPSGGHITINLVDKPQSIELTVSDDGIGVPKAEQHHLFSKFYRANNAKRARPDGTGLGLFMAKKVIAAQNGAIIFKSQEGKGSTFGFTFAKTKELLAPEQSS